MSMLLIASLIGLIFGSYLQVMLERLPRMLGVSPVPESYANSHFNLAWPRSHCPHCGTTLRFYDLIPLISYLQLKGCCRYCKERISFFYPAIEILTALLFVLIYLQAGISLHAVAMAAALSALLVLGVLDYRHHLLPDSLTLGLLWLGLIVNINGMFTPLPEAIIGAAAGYLSLWSIFWVHKWLTGKEGLGYGDFKLLAALGAWLGWTALPQLVVFASGLGLIAAVFYYFRGSLSRTTALPLGTFFAIAGSCLLLWR